MEEAWWQGMEDKEACDGAGHRTRKGIMEGGRA